MKKFYNYSLQEIEDYFIQNNYDSFDLVFYDIYGNTVFNVNIKKLTTVKVIELLGEKNPAKSILIHFTNKNKIRDFYIKFNIINNQIETILNVFYKKDIIFKDKSYLVESFYSFLNDQSYTIIWLDKEWLYTGNCFYNIEEIPKIINNLVFL